MRTSGSSPTTLHTNLSRPGLQTTDHAGPGLQTPDGRHGAEVGNPTHGERTRSKGSRGAGGEPHTRGAYTCPQAELCVRVEFTRWCFCCCPCGRRPAAASNVLVNMLSRFHLRPPKNLRRASRRRLGSPPRIFRKQCSRVGFIEPELLKFRLYKPCAYELDND